MKQLLDAVLELVGLFLADVFEPRPVVAQRRIRHGGLELAVADAVELEHEEQEMRRGGCEPLLHVGIEFRAHRVYRVAGVDQTGKRGEPPEEIVETLETLDRLRE